MEDLLGYEILGDSVNDLLEGEGLNDLELVGEDFDDDLLGAELIIGQDDDDLLGAELVIGEEEDLLIDEDLLGQMPASLKRMMSMHPKGRRLMQRVKATNKAVRGIRRRKAAQARRRANMAAAVAAKSAAVVREKPPTESREYPMGFDTVGTVAAGANVQIISRPQVTFRPERLVIAGAIAPSFLVNDLKVGKNSQFVNSAALPGDAFGPTAFGVRLRMDTAQISMDVVLDVTNISAGALRFNAALFGKAVQ